ncbi:MAG TPA: serine protease [Gemmatimonadaceae bacterium]|jgi:serine protease Do|nr:serine protease [Gemmatimonadaceae bacterium]
MTSTFTTESPIGATPSELIDHLTQWVVEVRHRGSTGTGILWGKSGMVLTNAHCVRDGEDPQIVTSLGTRRGRLLAVAGDDDLAAISVPGLAGPSLNIRDANALKTGELLFAYGHPLGVPNALSMGVLHAVVRHRNGEAKFVVADVRLAPGNSGGPLVDAKGQLVGINHMVANGLGVAIPATTVARFVDQVRAARAA